MNIIYIIARSRILKYLHFQKTIQNRISYILTFNYCFLLLLLTLPVGSCKKFIEVEAPVTSLNALNVYTTDATSISAVTSIYAKMSQATIYLNGIPSISFFAGLSADELALFPNILGLQAGHYANGLTSTNAPIFWTYFYQAIYQANSAIEGLNNSNTLTSSVKQQLEGEARFIRAFSYFYLVNLYGDVPLAISTNYKVNSLMTRTAAQQVWEQVIADLLESKNLLATGYVESDVVTSKTTTERVRPNKWTATALLARVYLFIGDYLNAEAQATEVINNTALYNMSSLNNVFLKNPVINPEALWQLQPVITGWNTQDARVFILPSTGPNTSTFPVYINKRLQFSFENGDLRKTAWMDSVKVGSDTFYYAHKYKSATLNAAVTEYNVVFRLAEQYLIRAEARSQQGNYIGAQSDLNIIRNRAGLSNTTASTKDNLLAAILRERRSELFTEWGHRWLDLKRTITVDAIIGIEAPLKGGAWEANDKWYPIPTDELITNPNLTQTPGYH